MRLRKQGYKGPVALLWADHLIKNVDEYLNLLKVSCDYVRKNPEKLLFVGEKPRFAWDNGGWIKFGKNIGGKFFDYKDWIYKPGLEKAIEMFESGEWVWNSGYVVEDLGFALSLFKKFQPQLYDGLEKIYGALDTEKEAKIIKEVYPNLPKISHDAAISQNVSLHQAVVYFADMGWSDPGTLYALKEALVPNESDNLEYGITRLTNSKDTMIYNLEDNKLVAGIGLEGMVVVNTKDAVLVAPKDKVLQISKLVESLLEDPRLKDFV
jgi:mannose-1-phosphate guanylyltransferase